MGAGKGRIWALACALFAASCGGEVNDGGPGCGGTPCGGDVVGRWQIVKVCLDTSLASSSNLPPECAGAIQTNASTTGTYEFRADGTMTMDTTIGGSVVETLTPACLHATGAPDPLDQSCADLSTQFSQLSDPTTGGATFQSAGCTYGSTGCVCTLRFDGQSRSTLGTYTVSGTTLVNASGAPLGYCVQGDDLRLFPTGTSGSATVSGSILLHRLP